MSDWYARTQGATLLEAENNRAPWDATDIETVIAFTDTDRDEDIAFALGRTLKSIQDIQWRMRHEGDDTLRAAYAPRPAYVMPTCLVHNIALTATGDCDWC